MYKRKFSIAILFILSLSVPLSHTTLLAQDQTWRWDNVERVVVIPDIHGAYPAFVRLLKNTKVVDDQLNWSGGTTHLVSLGDLLDRGSESRKTMDLLMRLQDQAKAAGGMVHVVAGNHELMNLIGDLRYVSKAEFAVFQNDETKEMREEAFWRYRINNEIAFDSELAAKNAFDKDFPPGYFAHRQAFSSQGKYGKWLLSMPAIVVVNDIAFVHAGLPEMVSSSSLARINKDYQTVTKRYLELWRELRDLNILPDDESQDATVMAQSVLKNGLPSDCLQVRQESCLEMQEDLSTQNKLNTTTKAKLEEFINLSQHPVIGNDGPLWTRGAIYCRDVFERPILDASLSALKVKQVVVGHTVTPDAKAHNLHDQQLTMLDTGMLVEYYNGRPAALLIQDGQQIVQYLDPDEQNSPIEELLPDAYQMTESEIEQALENGDVTVVDKPTGAKLGVGGSWTVQVNYKGKILQALFYPHDRLAQEKKELAAAALDELLGFDLVPITIERTLQNTSGALQLSFTDKISERTRVQKNKAIGGWCPLTRQFQLMYTWDVLTANKGRAEDNVHYRQNLGLLYLTRHNKAFGIGKTLPKSLGKNTIQLTSEVRKRLKQLTEQNLQAAVGDKLSKREINALLSRRNAMLKKFR